MMYITDKLIDLSVFFDVLPDASCGATAHFIGRVRNHQDGKRVTRLFYDCYIPMAEKVLGSIVHQVQEGFGVKNVRVLHRIGWLEVGEVAVAIAVSSAHREEAFSACRAMIEEIKKKVPIWKKEVYADGTSEWISNCGHSLGGRKEFQVRQG